MRNVHKFLLILVLLTLAQPAYSQEYQDILVTGYTCAYFGDGENKIFQKQADGNLELVTFEEASKGIASELAKLRKKLQTLNRQKKELPQNITNEDELLAQLNKKIKKQKKLISLRESELRALEDCRDGYRISNSVFNFKPVLGFRPEGAFVSLLVTTVRRLGKDNDSERAYCFHPVEPTDDFYSTVPQVRNFHIDPCVNPFNGTCVDQYFPKEARLGYFYFFDPVDPNNGDEVKNAMAALSQIFAKGFAGRPVKNDFDDCQDSP